MPYPLHRRFKFSRSILVVLLLLASGAAPFATPGFAQSTLQLKLQLVSAHVRPITGEVTITGTLTCSQDVPFAYLYDQVTQPVNRTTAVNGSGSIQVACTAAAPQPFSLRVVAFNGKFARGLTYIDLNMNGCTNPVPPDQPSCASASLGKTVWLWH